MERTFWKTDCIVIVVVSEEEEEEEEELSPDMLDISIEVMVLGLARVVVGCLRETVKVGEEPGGRKSRDQQIRLELSKVGRCLCRGDAR